MLLAGLGQPQNNMVSSCRVKWWVQTSQLKKAHLVSVNWWLLNLCKLISYLLFLQKRLHIRAAAPSRAPCPNRVSAFEKAGRSFAENPTESVITPVVGTTFDSVGEAYDYYNFYSWEKGFGIQYGKSRLNVKRTKCMQEIVYGCLVSTKFC